MKSLEEFVKYVKKRAYNLDERYANGNNHIRVSVFFTKDGQRQSIIQQKDRKSLSRLSQIIESESPQLVEVIIHINKSEELHRFHFSSQIETSYEGEKSFHINQFDGFGSITPNNIEDIINKRLQQERKDRLIIELQEKLKKEIEKLNNKNIELETLENTLNEKNEQIDDLEKQIESKKNFKYYAGITGDILQSFGVKKEIIGKPLAGLLSSEDEPSTNLIEQSSQDSSGIIEEDSQEVDNKKSEMLGLLKQYLQQLDQQTLEQVFHIFSVIEDDRNSAVKIIHFLNQQNK